MKQLKGLIPDIVAIVFFVIISFAYFMPATIDGRVLTGSDHNAPVGAGIENQEYSKRTGDITRWTNSLFSGMPTYQIAPSYKSARTVSTLTDIYRLYLPDYVKYVFIYLLGFYILLRAFNFKVWMAALGAVVWAFSSYFFIIITAGHIWKVYALAYMPPLIAGIVMCYRNKLLLGAILTAVFTAFEVSANHPQMTYYYMFVILFLVIAFFEKAIKEKTLKQFGYATAVIAFAGVVGISTSLPNLYHTWEYSKQSMRGKSELVQKQSAQGEQQKASDGLERDYITQWSYGIGETWSLLVPNVKGGSSSAPLASNEDARKVANSDFMPIYQQMGSYWGEQPGTSGPVYVGAFVLMLFFLGCIIVKGPVKWALIGGTLFSVFLSWGHNFMGLTDIFIDYVPLYNKFRAVSSILVVAEFTIPLLAMFALKRVVEVVDEQRQGLPTLSRKALFRATAISFGLTGGMALLFAVAPTMFFDSYVSSNEQTMLSNAVQAGYIPQDYLGSILANMAEMRKAIFTADAWRSFFIVLAGAVALVLFMMRKINSRLLVLGLTVLCLADMWTVNKRYLNDSLFVNASQARKAPVPTPTDEEILQDKSIDYRVLNLASNTFNENQTSYFHKSIGGYHAAKLGRYQELVDRYIHSEMGAAGQSIQNSQGNLAAVNGDSLMPVLNMLNTRYIIVPVQMEGRNTVPVMNPHANGNAWFVSEIRKAKNANEELDILGTIDTKTTAVVDERFADIAKGVVSDSTASVTMTSYEPNELRYKVSSAKGGVVVFSEIYYPGWTASVDGTETAVGRADYVLRFISVPEGEHEVVLAFRPKTVDTTEAVAYGAFALMMLGIVAAAVLEYRKKRKEA